MAFLLWDNFKLLDFQNGFFILTYLLESCLSLIKMAGRRHSLLLLVQVGMELVHRLVQREHPE